ncbi:hypothetical protein CCACVL1_16916 [Corchorus capsularis]|uniref:AB hydrolase-1 domain-containing protein n=1 Tax=Corchorus capsularis TaxID=210143 RepID=A0A1R3HVA0_COCAP|nr:hypothetical protein CCACVL1_16916 [Corchorus capsularis]
MGEVDPAFIQELEHRPKLSAIEAEGIPLIDLSVLNSADAEPDPNTLHSLVSEVGNACREWGFFQVINHGVSVEQRQKLEKASREFFAQQLEEKVKVRRDEVKVYGYYDGEHTKNVRDWKEVFDFLVQNPTIVPASKNPDDKEVIEWHNQWPHYPPELREACEEYSEELEKLAFKLMELIALSLGLPPNKFHVLGNSSEPYSKHFVLVHGSCHGSWSWYKLVPLLKSGGHNVTAIDLAGSGVDPQQVNTLRSISDYIKPLRDFMESLPDQQKVVLVGHSLGGLAISQAMERFPHKISVAVFVTALMPGPTLNISTLTERAYIVWIFGPTF